MSIYTKTGDKGTTSLYGGRRVLKSDRQIEAGGSLDELSSFLGLVSSKIKNEPDRSLLSSIQKDLYLIMGALSEAKVEIGQLEKQIIYFEQYIDKTSSRLSKITGFILPQGTEVSCWLHLLRTVCRRAERRVVFLSTQSTFNLSLLTLNLISKYLNRLSDLFFVLARKYNQEKEILV